MIRGKFSESRSRLRELKRMRVRLAVKDPVAEGATSTSAPRIAAALHFADGWRESRSFQRRARGDTQGCQTHNRLCDDVA
jgi:hypothetical protein